MMAHGHKHDTTLESSKDRGTGLSSDDLKIPIIKVLLEQEFSEEDVTLGLTNYRKKYPDHDKVVDSYMLDLVMEIPQSSSKDRKSGPNVSQNKKKPLQGQSKGSTWIDKLQARNN